MVEGAKRCPKCRSNLDFVPKLGLRTFECPLGHGVGINILEESHNLQRDELDAILQALKDAPLSDVASPITGKPMSTVTFLADDDTEIGNVGPGAQKLTIEVDVDNYFGWFSMEELRDLPLNVTKSGDPTHGFVGLDQLGRGDGLHDNLFGNLTSEDYDDASRRGPAPDSFSGLFGGIARRLRG